MGFFDLFRKKEKKENTTETNVSDSGKYETAERLIKEIYKETTVDCVDIELNENNPKIYESKIGGLPYIPKDCNYPVDKKGNQLRLLAQIECDKVDLPEYPDKGLLQIWIMPEDLFGADFDNPTEQNQFKIIYYKEIDKNVTPDDVKAKFIENEYEKNDDSYLPCSGEYGLTFKKSKNHITYMDERFNKLFCKKYNEVYPKNQIESYFDANVDLDEIECFENASEEAFGHKIGGYPAFTQEDPREDDDPHNFLLFQLDSDYNGEDEKVMWGDSGIGNFFINSEKLKNCDFSDVLYNWDCC